MKGKIVMKVRPCKDGGDHIMTKVDLKLVSKEGKWALLKNFLRGLEIPVEDAAGYLLMMATGEVDCVVMRDVKDVVEAEDAMEDTPPVACGDSPLREGAEGAEEGCGGTPRADGPRDDSGIDGSEEVWGDA